MSECRAGRINCIIIKDLSRLGRNYIETGDYLEQIFPMLGIRLIAVADGYDNLINGERLVSGLKNLVNDIYECVQVGATNFSKLFFHHTSNLPFLPFRPSLVSLVLHINHKTPPEDFTKKSLNQLVYKQQGLLL